MAGPFFKRASMPACPAGTLCGSIFISALWFNVERSTSNAQQRMLLASKATNVE
ncbi:MAG: hypothetical protein DMF47_00675 [Verrucomicrobia bacterium]|nr:MAG: hypothetical protein DMF47_00675 [Verrucomicrobiota bacterium]PYL84346.1 MAG: hypothetical protein DMF17_11455 [Verrucomicrobiota bacterium]